MITSFQYKGEWFLPAEPMKRITGILSYDIIEGSHLELFGNFDELPFGYSMRVDDIILGITNNSKQITLYNCYVSNSGGATLVSNGESGVPPTTYKIGYILEGVHVTSKEEMQFQEIRSEIYYLDEWLGVSGFFPNTDGLEQFKNFEINVKYKLPEPIRFEIDENLSGQFNFTILRPGLSTFTNNINLSQRVEIIISSITDSSLKDLLRNLFVFQNFLIFALYHRTHPTAITIYGNRFVNHYSDGTTTQKEIKLYFPIRYKEEDLSRKPDLEMLFSYGQIKEEFPSIIKKWYKQYDLLEPAFNLLVEQFYNKGRFSSNTFLNLAQAAETLHTRTDNHTKMPKQDYQVMKEEIYTAVPKKHHEWLREQFNFGNNLNLHARLKDMVSKYSNGSLDKAIGDKDSFVNQVKHSRNYYTHYSKGSEKHALKEQPLFFLTEKIKILLVCAFLIEAGFDKKKLESLLESNERRFIRHLINR